MYIHDAVWRFLDLSGAVLLFEGMTYRVHSVLPNVLFSECHTQTFGTVCLCERFVRLSRNMTIMLPANAQTL